MKRKGPGAIQVDGAWLEYALTTGGLTIIALAGPSLTVQPGEFVAIVGPSGCGKTSLLMALAGLVPLTRGAIAIDGTPVRGPGLDRAVVFQEPGLLPWRTVRSNIALGLEAKALSRAERGRTAEEFLRMVGLARFGHYYPHQLSGGMRQRVGIARALAVDPQVLLMDEPFAALDAQTRDRLGAELLAIWARARKTVVFVTHSIDEAIYLSDRVLIMTHRPGRIRAETPVELPRPRTDSVRNSPEFAKYRAEIWNELATEVDQAERAELGEAGGPSAA